MPVDLYPYAFLTITVAMFGALLSKDNFREEHGTLMHVWGVLVWLAGLYLFAHPFFGQNRMFSIGYLFHMGLIAVLNVLLIITIVALSLDSIPSEPPPD